MRDKIENKLSEMEAYRMKVAEELAAVQGAITVLKELLKEEDEPEEEEEDGKNNPGQRERTGR